MLVVYFWPFLIHSWIYFSNSSLIEIPFPSYLPSSSSSSAGINNSYYGRSKYHNNYKPIEEGSDDFNDRDYPLQYREYEFADEFGPTNAYEIQSNSDNHSKFHRPY